ncbi:hypothetical protein [Streptomyces malaysiensis]
MADDFLSTQRAALIAAAVATISDPVERYNMLTLLLKLVTNDIKAAKADVASQLKQEDRTWDEVGELLGVTGSRAEQISRAAR